MNIAIIRLSSLGDVVFSAPVASWLKALYPNSKISWFIDSDFKEVLEDNPHIDELITINLRQLKKTKNISTLIREIGTICKYPKFDYIIDLQGLLKSSLIASLLKGKKIGFDAKSAREGVASFFYDQKIAADYNLNVLKRYEILIKNVFGEFETVDMPAIYTKNENSKTTDAVLINTGASKANKKYPHFVDIIKGIDREVFLIWGSLIEYESAKEISSKTGAVILPRLGIGELKGTIKSAALVIGGDSGVTHLAWGLKRPSITLFGATPIKRNCVETDINLALNSGQNVDAQKLNYNDFSIAKINPQTIIDAAKRLL